MEARLGTWRLDVSPGAAESDPWRIAAVSRLSVVTGLYRLSLNPAKQYDVHDLTVRAPDLTIEMSSGRAFVAETPDGAERRRPARPRPDAVHAAGSGRAHTGPDLCRSRGARRRHRRGLPAVLAGRVRIPLRFRVASAAPGQPGRLANGDLGVQRVRRPDPADRPLGHQPRSVVVEPVLRRPHRRASDEAVRHAHLRAIGRRRRRRHGVRSTAAPQHLDLRVGREAGAAGALLQRRRSRRLRRAVVRHRRRVRAGSRDRRRHDQDAG